MNNLTCAWCNQLIRDICSHPSCVFAREQGFCCPGCRNALQLYKRITLHREVA